MAPAKKPKRCNRPTPSTAVHIGTHRKIQRPFTEPEHTAMINFLVNRIRNPTTGKLTKPHMGMKAWKEFTQQHAFAIRKPNCYYSYCRRTLLPGLKYHDPVTQLVLHYGLSLNCSRRFLRQMDKGENVKVKLNYNKQIVAFKKRDGESEDYPRVWPEDEEEEDVVEVFAPHQEAVADRLEGSLHRLGGSLERVVEIDRESERDKEDEVEDAAEVFQPEAMEPNISREVSVRSRASSEGSGDSENDQVEEDAVEDDQVEVEDEDEANDQVEEDEVEDARGVPSPSRQGTVSQSRELSVVTIWEGRVGSDEEIEVEGPDSETDMDE